MKTSIWFISCLSIIFSSCAGINLPDTKNTEYSIGIPNPPWTKMETRGLDADQAYKNPKTGSTIYIRSSCNLYKDASLDHLMKGLLNAFQESKIKKSRIIHLVKREAKETVLIGKLDGHKIKSKITVLKKNSCFFDFVFISLPKYYKNDIHIYDTYVETFSL